MENQRFWEFVEKVNWKQYFHREGRVDLDEVVLDIAEYFTWEEFTNFEGVYKKYYNEAFEKFENAWLNDDENDMPSDDGYTDLISSIVGKGYDFYKNIDNDEFIEMANDHDYRENFGYLFHRTDWDQSKTGREFYNKYNARRRGVKIDEILND